MKEKLSWLSNCGAAFFTIIQTNQIFQLISLILTCIAVFLSICITLYNLYKKLKEGKLKTSDLIEAKKEVEDAKKEIEELKEKLEKEKNNAK